MKNQWWIYVIVAAISGIAGVVITGLPNGVSSEPTISVPASTSTTTTEAPAVVTTTTGVASSESADEGDGESGGTTDLGDGSDTNEVGTTNDETPTSTQTESADTTTTTDASEPPRENVVVVAVNGASIGGVATDVRLTLKDLGYDLARAADGRTIVDETVIYYAPGFEVEASVVAFLLGRDVEAIQPVVDAPSFGLQDDDQVVVYLGRDWS